MMTEKSTHITGWADKGEYVVVDFLGRATIKTSYDEITDLMERLTGLHGESLHPQEVVRVDPNTTLGDVMRKMGVHDMYEDAHARAEKKRAEGDKEDQAYWVGKLGGIQDAADAINELLKKKGIDVMKLPQEG